MTPLKLKELVSSNPVVLEADKTTVADVEYAVVDI